MFDSPLSRREMLHRCGAGFGALAFASTFAQAETHFPAKAKRVIVLFMNGGPSHVDTFDPKPMLKKFEGDKPTDKIKRKVGGGYVPSPFTFKPHGQSGVVMSELFPNLAKCADDLCVIRSMHTDEPNHEPGLLMMHSGNQQPIRPSLGSWLSYGLGTENQNLPGYVVLAPGKPVVGPQLWSSSFLPGSHQAMAVNTKDMTIGKLIADLNHPSLKRDDQRKQLDLMQQLNQIHAAQRNHDAALETRIQSMETAFAMQTEAAEAFDISRESKATLKMYGDSAFGKQCLLARRLSERGVRFVQAYYVDGGNQPWDTHQNNDKGHRRLCADSDQATAALLTDLKQRGLLDDTLVIWGGEFGRTPYAQPSKNKGEHGRDHHHTAFSMVMAGGGTKGGTMYGQTDEFGMNAVEDRVHVHDFHATILHLMGLDHEKLTYRYAGRDFRLTDVHGRVVRGVIA